MHRPMTWIWMKASQIFVAERFKVIRSVLNLTRVAPSVTTVRYVILNEIQDHSHVPDFILRLCVRNNNSRCKF